MDSVVSGLRVAAEHGATCIAMTSVRSAQCLIAALDQLHGSEVASWASDTPVYCVGRKTAHPLMSGCEDKLGKINVCGPTAAALGAALCACPAVNPGPVAVLQGDKALPDLPQALEAGGLRHQLIHAYSTTMQAAADISQAAPQQDVVAGVVFSPSGLPAALAATTAPLIAIGPTTAAAALKAGAADVATAPTPTPTGVGAALQALLSPPQEAAAPSPDRASLGNESARSSTRPAARSTRT